MAENLYHNLRKRMKVIESDLDRVCSEVKELNEWRLITLERIKDNTEHILGRVRVLEEHLTSLDRTCEGGNDPRDGGWFD